MKPAQMLYWTRAGSGVAVGAICAIYDYATGAVFTTTPSINDFFTGLTLALFLFLVTYYILKPFLGHKFEKKTKLLTTGIGAYFLLWLIMWVLLDSIIRGPM